MEALQNRIRGFVKDSKWVSSASDINSSRVNESLSASLSASDNSRLLVARPPRQVVSLWTCSKLCAICFAVGVVAGYTLKRRVRRWASRLLKRLKDD